MTDLDVHRFGARGDGVADDAPALQRALDIAVDTTYPLRRVRLRPGSTYRIDTPLILGRHSGGAWQQVHGVEITSGVGRGGYLAGSGAVIAPTYLDGPALAIQWAKQCRVSGVMFQGAHATGFPSMGDLLDDTFWEGGARDNRWSPYAAIAVDCIAAGIAQPDRYPFVDAASLESVTQGGGSAYLTVEGCVFDDWLVGVGLTLHPTVQNGEQITMRDCRWSRVRDAVAAGQSQTRGCAIVDCGFMGVGCLVNGITYGKSQGAVPDIRGGHCTYVRRLTAGRPQFGGTRVQGFYAEAFHEIGHHEAGYYSQTWDGCTLKSRGGGAGPGTSDWLCLAETSPVAFRSCAITAEGGDGVLSFYLGGNHETGAPGYSFESCTFGQSDGKARVVSNVPERVRFTNCGGYDQTSTPTYQAYHDRLTLPSWSSLSSAQTGLYLSPGATLSVEYEHHVVDWYDPRDTLGAPTSATWTASGVSFDIAGADRCSVGDVLVGAHVCGWVTAHALGGHSTAVHYHAGVVTDVTGSRVTLGSVPASLLASQDFGPYALQRYVRRTLQAPGLEGADALTYTQIGGAA